MRRCITFAFTAVVLLGWAPSARADSETARQHFETGKHLRDENRCAEAIPEFEKSVAAERSIGATYNLAYCHEQLGRRQEAYDAYKQAQQLASVKKDDRLREISGALASLLETPHIRLVLPQPLPEGLQIKVDDQIIPSSVYQTETVIFTKPNKYHVVIVTAPGYEDRRETVETKQLKAIDLRRPNRPVVSAPAEMVESDGWTGTHWLGLGLAAGGLLAAGATVLVIVDHRSRIDDIATTYDVEVARDCPPGSPPSCKSAKTNRRNDDTTSENTRVIIVGGLVGAVGVALLVSGGILFATAGGKKTATTSQRLELVPQVSQRDLGLSLVGRF